MQFDSVDQFWKFSFGEGIGLDVPQNSHFGDLAIMTFSYAIMAAYKKSEFLRTFSQSNYIL